MRRNYDQKRVWPSSRPPVPRGVRQRRRAQASPKAALPPEQVHINPLEALVVSVYNTQPLVNDSANPSPLLKSPTITKQKQLHAADKTPPRVAQPQPNPKNPAFAS